MQREARIRGRGVRACAGQPAVSSACNRARNSDLCGAKEPIYFHCSQRGGPGRAESITIPSIHSCGGNMDIIYMVMRARWPPRVTPWTSLTVDSSGVPWHPNGMRRCGRTRTHTHAHTNTRVRARSGPAARRHVSISRCRSAPRCVCSPG